MRVVKRDTYFGSCPLLVITSTVMPEKNLTGYDRFSAVKNHLVWGKCRHERV
jgi:hypothetical protein